MNTGLLSVATLAERLHRRSQEVLDRHLTALGHLDLTATQAMILMHLGAEQMTVTELTSRGCYQGTNVSYNLKRLIENAYLVQERSERDHRVVHIRASRRGRQLQGDLTRFYAVLDQGFAATGRLDLPDVAGVMTTIEHFLHESDVKPVSEERNTGPSVRKRTGRESPRSSRTTSADAPVATRRTRA